MSEFAPLSGIAPVDGTQEFLNTKSLTFTSPGIKVIFLMEGHGEWDIVIQYTSS